MKSIPSNNRMVQFADAIEAETEPEIIIPVIRRMVKNITSNGSILGAAECGHLGRVCYPNSDIRINLNKVYSNLDEEEKNNIVKHLEIITQCVIDGNYGLDQINATRDVEGATCQNNSQNNSQDDSTSPEGKIIKTLVDEITSIGGDMTNPAEMIGKIMSGDVFTNLVSTITGMNSQKPIDFNKLVEEVAQMAKS
jgi:hypothetical protein